MATMCINIIRPTSWFWETTNVHKFMTVDDDIYWKINRFRFTEWIYQNGITGSLLIWDQQSGMYEEWLMDEVGYYRVDE